MVLLPARTDYSRAERVSDTIIHIAGLLMVLAAVPVLITLAAFLRGDFTGLLAVSVYGGALTAMIGASAVYNLVSHPGWSGLLRRIDHSAIYVKIAGTYTPFTLLSGQGFWLLAGLWGAAIAGVGLKIAAPERFRLLALALYLGMGWAGIAAGGSFLATLSGPVIVLVVTGGVLYTVGVLFYLFEKLPFHYTIWHALVLAASGVFYAAVTVHLVQTA